MYKNKTRMIEKKNMCDLVCVYNEVKHGMKCICEFALDVYSIMVMDVNEIDTWRGQELKVCNGH